MLPTVWATSQEDAIAQTGWLITLYALGVVVGAPTIAGSVAKYPRHHVMVGLALALTGFVAPAWVGVGLALGGLAIAMWSLARERSRVAVAV